MLRQVSSFVLAFVVCSLAQSSRAATPFVPLKDSPIHTFAKASDLALAEVGGDEVVLYRNDDTSSL